MADRPRFEITPGKEKCARGVIGGTNRRRVQVWCYPGKDTPSAPGTALVTPTVVGITPAGINEMVNLEMRRKREIVPIVPLLSTTTENQCELQPHDNVSDDYSINFPAEPVSAKCNLPTNNIEIFPGPNRVNDRIHTLNASEKKGL